MFHPNHNSTKQKHLEKNDPELKGSPKLLFRFSHESAQLSFGSIFRRANSEKRVERLRPRSSNRAGTESTFNRRFRSINKEHITTTTTTYKIHPSIKCVQTLKLPSTKQEEEKIEWNGIWKWRHRLELIPEEICQHPISLVNVPPAHADSPQHPPPEAKGSVGVGWTRIGAPFAARASPWIGMEDCTDRGKWAFLFKYLYAY